MMEIIWLYTLAGFLSSRTCTRGLPCDAKGKRDTVQTVASLGEDGSETHEEMTHQRHARR